MWKIHALLGFAFRVRMLAVYEPSSSLSSTRIVLLHVARLMCAVCVCFVCFRTGVAWFSLSSLLLLLTFFPCTNFSQHDCRLTRTRKAVLYFSLHSSLSLPIWQVGFGSYGRYTCTRYAVGERSPPTNEWKWKRETEREEDKMQSNEHDKPCAHANSLTQNAELSELYLMRRFIATRSLSSICTRQRITEKNFCCCSNRFCFVLFGNVYKERKKQRFFHNENHHVSLANSYYAAIARLPDVFHSTVNTTVHRQRDAAMRSNDDRKLINRINSNTLRDHNDPHFIRIWQPNDFHTRWNVKNQSSKSITVTSFEQQCIAWLTISNEYDFIAMRLGKSC